jgi:hypothetical protein
MRWILLLGVALLWAPAARAESDPVREFWESRLGPEDGSRSSAVRVTKPLFTVPVRRILLEGGSQPTLQQLPGKLQAFSEALLATARTAHDRGYDWFFPQVYAHVTREILAEVQAGGFVHPELCLQEILQFYEIYAANANRWMRDATPEPPWASASSTSCTFRNFDNTVGRTRHDRMNFAVQVLLLSMYAHIEVDLPRALMMIYFARQAAEPDPAARQKLLADMQRDFRRLTPAFDRAVAKTMDSGQTSWQHNSHLPSFLRWLLETVGAGPAVRLMRTSALRHFGRGVKNDAFRAELMALPVVAVPFALPFPTPVAD